MSDLKPCPFCGSPDIEFETDGDGNGWGACKGCGARGPFENKRQGEDDPDWNARARKE